MRPGLDRLLCLLTYSAGTVSPLARLSQEKRKAKRLEGELHGCQQRLDHMCPDHGGHPSSSTSAAAGSHLLPAAAPLALLLLGAHHIVNMDFNAAVQDDAALSNFSKQLDSLTREVAVADDMDHPWCPVRLLLVKHFSGILPDITTSAGLDSLAEQRLLPLLLRHAFMHVLLESLWRDPLGLMGVPSHSLVLEESERWGASTAEKEAALQLDAAAYQRLYQRVAAAFLPSGSMHQITAAQRGSALPAAGQRIPHLLCRCGTQAAPLRRQGAVPAGVPAAAAHGRSAPRAQALHEQAWRAGQQHEQQAQHCEGCEWQQGLLRCCPS
jgi:hypothetical protein